MAEPSNTTEQIFSLSSLDQSATRTYSRIALCYAHEDANVEATSSRLIANLKRLASSLPLLAGTVRPANIETSLQQGLLEVTVTLRDVINFEPTIKHLSFAEFPHSFENVMNDRMPLSAVTRYAETLSPLPDNPEPSESPVFALQANFLTGGLIVALYLHKSVADIVGLKTIINHLSSNMPTCNLTCEDLKDEAKERSRLRDRLSGSRGVKSDIAASVISEDSGIRSAEEYLTALTIAGRTSTSNVFFFDLDLIGKTTEMLNSRFHHIANDTSVNITAFDTLAAILWKGILRARVNTDQEAQRLSSLSIPVNIRKGIDPPLDDSYFGNATSHGLATSGIIQLLLPYEMGALATTARTISTTIRTMSEQRMSSVIASTNESRNVQSASIMSVNLDTDLNIASWADLSLDEADLGLGIGYPTWVRKIGRSNGNSECIMYPPKREQGWWEVMVELKKSEMGKLVQDEGFLKFLVHVA